MTRKYTKTGIPQTAEYRKKIAAIKFAGYATMIDFAKDMDMSVILLRYLLYNRFNLLQALKFQYLTNNFLKIEELLPKEAQSEFEIFKRKRF